MEHWPKMGLLDYILSYVSPAITRSFLEIKPHQTVLFMI